MITIFWIGFVLCWAQYFIYLNGNLEKKEFGTEPYKTISFRVWHLILFTLATIMPFLNLFVAMMTPIITFYDVGSYGVHYRINAGKGSSKIIKFLNKKVRNERQSKAANA